MEVEFGQVQEYNTERGFGFVSRTFRNANQRLKKMFGFTSKKSSVITQIWQKN